MAEINKKKNTLFVTQMIFFGVTKSFFFKPKIRKNIFCSKYFSFKKK